MINGIPLQRGVRNPMRAFLASSARGSQKALRCMFWAMVVHAAVPLPAGSENVIIPVVATWRGEKQTEWRTKIDVLLPVRETSEESVDLTVWIHEKERGSTSAVLRVLPGAVASFRLDELLPGPRVGALEIVAPDCYQPTVFAAIFDEDENGQRTGGHISGVDASDLLQAGDASVVLPLRGSDAELSEIRSSLGWYQHDAGLVRFEVFLQSYELLTVVAMTLPERSHFQYRGVLSLGDLERCYVIARVESGSGIGYRVFVDNKTNDSTIRLFEQIATSGNSIWSEPAVEVRTIMSADSAEGQRP